MAVPIITNIYEFGYTTLCHFEIDGIRSVYSVWGASMSTYTTIPLMTEEKYFAFQFVPHRRFLNNGTHFSSMFVILQNICEPITDNTLIHTSQFMNDLYEPLAMLHSSDIIHRDVKLENILYCRKENKFKLIDFGRTTSIGWELGKYGTPGYLHDNMRIFGYPDVFFNNNGLPTFDAIVKEQDQSCEFMTDHDVYKQNDIYALYMVHHVLTRHNRVIHDSPTKVTDLYKRICPIHKKRANLKQKNNLYKK